MEKIRIVWSDGRDGEGLREHRLVDSEACLDDLIIPVYGMQWPQKTTARVNGAIVDGNYRLREGDRVVLSPQKVMGA